MLFRSLVTDPRVPVVSTVKAALSIDVEPLGGDPLGALFCEELGAVLQVRAEDVPKVRSAFDARGLGGGVVVLGSVEAGDRIAVGALRELRDAQ